MKFKKLEMYGFKSFADKIEVKFDSGITGIVGPNGCGKSNVADAIRWVLGEQSAKALRGSSMQDVIFNGTEKRKSQSFSEVSLYFDNSSQIFPNLAYDEVVISRKLYRSGESEYAINKSPCRLKDVVDTLRDSGLGKEGYSVIGQGRIDEILSAKPEERRAVFEEAAGVSKLKSRKTEAERKLEHTRNNLVRLNDIISELEIQLGPLKKQSENAKKYLDYREKLKTLEVNAYIYQYETSNTSKKQIQTRLDAVSEELALKEDEFQKCLEHYNSTFEEIKKLDENIENLRDELLNLTVGLEKQSGESKLLQERITNFKEQNNRITTEIENNERDFEQNNVLLESKKLDQTTKQHILEELERKLEKSMSNYLAIVDKITESEINVESTSNQMFEALDKLSDVKADISSLRTERASLTAKQDEINTRKSEIDTKTATYKAEVEDVTQSVFKIKNIKNELEITRDRQIEENNTTNATIISLEDKLSESKAEYHSLDSKHKLLLEMQKANEGFAFSVKRILEDSKTNSTLAGKVVGVVAKLMTVPKDYETAIEMALGSAVQNIVTKSDQDAKYVIEHLKTNSYGRATFIPQNTVKPRRIDRENLLYISSGKGVFGIASELIKYDSKLKDVFEFLLGSTVLVDNMNNALTLARQCKYSFRIVTLEGDILNPQGTMTGGSKKYEGTNIISRDREIQDMSKRIAELESDINRINGKLAGTKIKLSELLEGIKTSSNSIHQQEVSLIKEQDKLAKLKSFIDELNQENDHLERQYEFVEKRIFAIDQSMRETSDLEKEISGKKESASETKKQENTEFDKLKKKREQYYDELTDIRVKKASTEGELSAIAVEIERIIKTRETLNYSIKERKLARQINLTEIAELESKFESLVDKNKYNENIKSLQSVRDKLANLDSYKDELNTKLSQFDQRKMLISDEIQRANDKKYREETMLAKIDSDIEMMQERVYEEYELTYSSSLEYRNPNFDLDEGMIEIGRLKRSIQHLGYVNVNAIEQLTEVSERYEDMTTQRDDLVKAESDLNKIIKELTVQMEIKFKEEFHKINKNFQQVFKELFGGGRAELKLHEDEPVLEAGIDIVAEPPGKKLQSIMLLSGGERALTAIAILFAILKLRPMPFCVLDEIEAALDDSNAERFAKYLKRFSASTQFIVITHRKPTMELADALYGVTMEEKGISKIVSVQFKEAVKNATEEAV